MATFRISRGLLSIRYDKGIISETPATFIGDSIIKQNYDTYKVVSVDDSILILLENDDGRPGNIINRFTFIREAYYADYLTNHSVLDYYNDTTVLLDKRFLPFYSSLWDFRIRRHNVQGKLDGFVSMDVLIDSTGKTVAVNVTSYRDVPEEVARKAAKMIKQKKSWIFWRFKRNLYYRISIVAVFWRSPEGYSANIKLFE